MTKNSAIRSLNIDEIKLVNGGNSLNEDEKEADPRFIKPKETICPVGPRPPSAPEQGLATKIGWMIDNPGTSAGWFVDTIYCAVTQPATGPTNTVPVIRN